MALRWADVDLEKGRALSRASDNKGKRNQLVALHPIVLDHLRTLTIFGPLVFAWDHSRRSLFCEFQRLQKASGLILTGERRHYGFHDLQQAFATLNANLTPDAVQAVMQHRAYQTTQRYINRARQLAPGSRSFSWSM